MASISEYDSDAEKRWQPGTEDGPMAVMRERLSVWMSQAACLRWTLRLANLVTLARP